MSANLLNDGTTSYTYDALGNVRQMVDDTGGAFAAYRYDPWDLPREDSPAQPFGFTGEVQDASPNTVPTLRLDEKMLGLGLVGANLCVRPSAGQTRRSVPTIMHSRQSKIGYPLGESKIANTPPRSHPCGHRCRRRTRPSASAR